MPKSKKPARSGKGDLLSGVKKPAFDPRENRLPKGLKSDHNLKGGKPKLFPGRNGAR